MPLAELVRPELVLDDELGLGLAALAATVANRLVTRTRGPTEVVEFMLRRYRWLVDAVCEPYDGGLTESWVLQVLTSVSTYLALTDRLCQAVRMERCSDEVARWVPMSDGGRRLLVSHRDGTESWQVFRGLHGDWLSAIDAALREVEP